jgi:hypothetical protein
MAKWAYSRTIVSLAPSGHEESYLPTLEVQKEKDAETERAFRGQVDLKLPRPKHGISRVDLKLPRLRQGIS